MLKQILLNCKSILMWNKKKIGQKCQKKLLIGIIYSDQNLCLDALNLDGILYFL